MKEEYDLLEMIEELPDDENVGASKKRKVTQEEITRLVRKMAASQAARDVSKLPLGEALVHDGLISREQLLEALKLQTRGGEKIGSILVKLGHISDEQLLAFLAAQHGIESTSLMNLSIREDVMNLLPSVIILKHRVLPMKADAQSINIAMENPDDHAAIRAVEFTTGKRVNPVIVPSHQMKQAIEYIERKEGGLFSGLEMQDAMKDREGVRVLLEKMVSMNASDLLITAGVPPSAKKYGDIIRIDVPSPSQDQSVTYAKSLMNERQWEDFLRNKELDFATRYEGLGRFRINAYRQKDTVSLCIRRISEKIPTLEELGLPPWLGQFAQKKHGLIVLASSVGQGKTTTVSALIDLINTTRKVNIITLEDPIEYVHQSKKSNVNQRAVGIDTDSFGEGLRRIFRQSPDVIMIGEMRDPETFEIALMAASTGHLVLSTMHSSYTTAAIEGIINRFPRHLQGTARLQIADAVSLVFTQRLLPRKGGGPAVVAYEKLISSHRIKNLIRENKVHQIRTQIQGDAEDFSSLDVSLARLVAEDKLAIEDALDHAESPDAVANASRKAKSKSTRLP
jgi:twitching motility protein PilT